MEDCRTFFRRGARSYLPRVNGIPGIAAAKLFDTTTHTNQTRYLLVVGKEGLHLTQIETLKLANLTMERISLCIVSKISSTSRLRRRYGLSLLA
jgi:hypothetical protein